MGSRSFSAAHDELCDEDVARCQERGAEDDPDEVLVEHVLALVDELQVGDVAGGASEGVADGGGKYRLDPSTREHQSSS